MKRFVTKKFVNGGVTIAIRCGVGWVEGEWSGLPGAGGLTLCEFTSVYEEVRKRGCNDRYSLRDGMGGEGVVRSPRRWRANVMRVYRLRSTFEVFQIR